ncbi:pyruvate decarboxylase [Fusarium austroafricanum]|uniref:Pyruvate decarboxylase n=1 Tax=Fusarium austroafricanum TaxID=2364996 RepID=A0A8H4KX48_9HYPO|nr:pyruvate decarboxylase [Fusarium austroafricanum]
MADGLSVASGVSGLNSLGLTLCNGLQAYFSAIQDRDTDVRLATQNLDLLRFNVKTIELSRSKLKKQHSPCDYGLDFGLRNCEAQLRVFLSLQRTFSNGNREPTPPKPLS